MGQSHADEDTNQDALVVRHANSHEKGQGLVTMAKAICREVVEDTVKDGHCGYTGTTY